MILDTKQDPQSHIGRFNIVIGQVYQDTTVVEKWIGFRWMRSGVEECMKGY